VTSRTNIIKDEKGDLVRDSHSILARWRNHFSQLLNVQGFNDIRQRKIHTAKLPVPELSALEIQMAIEKLRKHKSPGIDQIPAEMIKAGGRTIRFDISKLTNSTWNEEELQEEWKELIILPIYKKGDKTDCSNYREMSHVSTIHRILFNILLSRLTPYAEEIIGDHQCGFQCNRSTTDDIFYICKILKKKWEYSEAVHQLFVDFKGAYV